MRMAISRARGTERHDFLPFVPFVESEWLPHTFVCFSAAKTFRWRQPELESGSSLIAQPFSLHLCYHTILFIRPKPDHCLPLSLTDSLTHSCLVDLTVVTLAFENCYLYFIDQVTCLHYITEEYNLGLESVGTLSSFTDIDYHSSSKIVRTCKIEFFPSILRIEICCHMKVIYI